MKTDSKNIMDMTFSAVKERLHEGIFWFPLPALISFVFVINFIARITFDINPRLGNAAEVLEFDGKIVDDNGIWISISPLNDTLKISTFDKKTFIIPMEVESEENIAEFANYLRKKVIEIGLNAGLKNRLRQGESKVIISADKHLKYAHIKPIIHALALAQISNYAFETKVMNL